MNKCLFEGECEEWAPDCNLEKLTNGCYPRFSKEVSSCNLCGRKEVTCCEVNKSISSCSECFRGLVFPRRIRVGRLETEDAERLLERILDRWDKEEGSIVLDYSQLD